MITICYITFRREPRIQWFIDSLNSQLGNDLVNGVVISEFADDVRKEINGRWRCFLPKPNVWSGPHRLTTKDYFSAASVRNTGLCLAPDGYIVYVDDLSVLMPGWWERVKIAAGAGYVACGVYRKVFDLEVEEATGIVRSFRDSPGGHDTRLPQLDSDEVKPCSGGWLYGCSVAMPVEALLKINGWDEYRCDSSGFEDVSCGFRLQRTGADLRIDPKMMTWEDEALHNQGTPALRIIKPYHGYKDSSWAVEDWFKHGSTWADIGFDIRELRQKILAGEPFPIPTEPSKDWRDGQPLSEM